MTTALTLKCLAGIVLAADSATTLPGSGGDPEKVYYSGSKVFQLHDTLPLGGLTWGLGSMGAHVIATLAKELRLRLSRPRSRSGLDPSRYTVRQAAEKTRAFLYREAYRRAYPGPSGSRPEFGFVVAGYSAGSDLPEAWLIRIDANGKCPAPVELRRDDYGLDAFGQAEAINRLVLGYTRTFPDAAERLGVDAAPALEIFEELRPFTDPVTKYLPIREAIELADFLIRAEIEFHRFAPSEPVPTVGGPIEIIAIGLYDGLHWVSRTDHFRPLDRRRR